MSKDTGIHEVLPKLGFLFEEDSPATIVSKPKLMPLKTVTLEKVSASTTNDTIFDMYLPFILFNSLKKCNWKPNKRCAKKLMKSTVSSQMTTNQPHLQDFVSFVFSKFE